MNQEVYIASIPLGEFIMLVIMSVGLAIALWQLKWSMPPRRHLDIILDFSRTWQSETFIEARALANKNAKNLKQAIEDYEDKNAREYWLLTGIPNFFEDLGTLKQRKQLNFEEIEDHFGAQICYYYQIFKPWIDAKQAKCSEMYKYFKSLAEEIEQLYKEKGWI